MVAPRLTIASLLLLLAALLGSGQQHSTYSIDFEVIDEPQTVAIVGYYPPVPMLLDLAAPAPTLDNQVSAWYLVLDVQGVTANPDGWRLAVLNSQGDTLYSEEITHTGRYDLRSAALDAWFGMGNNRVSLWLRPPLGLPFGSTAPAIYIYTQHAETEDVDRIPTHPHVQLAIAGGC